MGMGASVLLGTCVLERQPINRALVKGASNLVTVMRIGSFVGKH